MPSLLDPILFLLVGTYTSKTSEGIYLFKFNQDDGTSEFISSIKTPNPSYLTISNDTKYVYSVSENDDSSASASSFSFDKANGKLNFINSNPTHGTAPCYINIDQKQTHVVTANYNGGSLSVYELDKDYSLKPSRYLVQFVGHSINPSRQNEPHIHCTVFSPDDKYLYVTDLGTDHIHKFEVTSDSNFVVPGNPPNFKIEDGSGPRHLTFHPNGKYAYLICELKGTIIAFSYSSLNGDFVQIQTIECDSVHASGSADIHISPDGRFLYGSNRLQNDGIAIFDIDSATGVLKQVGYQVSGKTPRNFVITPNGKFVLVACQDGDVIEVYSRDENSGLLTATTQTISVSMPVCLVFTNIE